ncbi:MAG: hypothetical protein IJF07_09650 [Lachnospiraceae bacterium]|nr:hypothetical protein [Lachnospiraceae bacterium]
MKKSTTSITIIIIIMIVGVVGYYTYLSNKSRTLKEETALTQIQETLARDLSLDYPPSPKETIKYYNEIIDCLYNEECSEADIEALGQQARELYDADLLANNENEMYLVNLKAEVQDYKENQRRIVSVVLEPSADVDRYEEDGYSFARIRCSYNMMENGEAKRSDQVYLLRRDENKKWKIYGWMSLEEYNALTSQE